MFCHSNSFSEIEDTSSKSGKPYKLFKFIRWVFTALSIAFIAYFVGRNFQSVRIKDVRWLIYCLSIPLVLIPLIVNYRWKFFLALNGIRASIVELAKINFLSIFYGIILPSSSGLDAVRILMIELKYPEKRGQAGSTVILERLMGLLSLCLIGMITSLLIPADLASKSSRHTILVVTLFIAGCIVFILTPLFYKIMHKLLYGRLPGRRKLLVKVTDYIEKVHKALQLAVSPGMLIKSFLLILLFQMSTIVNVAMVFKALGVNLTLDVHMMIMPIIYIFSIVPITISGFGVREGLFAYLYSGFGVDSATAVMASLINYAILTMVPALIGFILSLIHPNSLNKGQPSKNPAKTP